MSLNISLLLATKWGSVFTFYPYWFELPEQEKDKVNVSKYGKQLRGWIQVHREKTSNLADGKESYYFSRDVEYSEQRVSHGPNRYRDEDIDMKHLINNYMEQMEQLGFKMISYVSLALGLQEQYLAERFNNPEPLILMRGFISYC